MRTALANLERRAIAAVEPLPACVPATAPVASAGASRRSAYLALAAILAPLCVPAGPAQSAALDVVNVAALAAFGLALLVPGRRLRAPLVLPAALVAIGSLVATLSAPSAGLAALALAQDAYLFAWFLLIVNLVREPADVRLVRVAWTWTAVAVSLGAVGQLLVQTHGSLGTLLGARGFRPASTLYNPNMLADYLVSSVFVAASLAHEVPRGRLALAIGVLLVGLLATKSNGGAIALAAGAVVWAVVAAVTSGVSVRRVAAVTALLAGVLGLAVWFNAEWGVGDSALASLGRHTFVGRMEHSSASRLHIWEQLERSYARSPLGIGPGNSGALTLSIAERERPNSYRSKEAHSDYLAYAIERGPLGVAGLLLMTILAFLHVGRYWNRARRAPEGRRSRRGAAMWTAAMAGALTASTVHSTVIEKLHFRHFWLLLGLVCGSALMAAGRRDRPAPAEAPR